MVHQYTEKHTDEIDFVCNRDNLRCVVPATSNWPDYQGWQDNIYTCYGSHFLLRVARRSGPEPYLSISLVGLDARHHSHWYKATASGNHREYTFGGPVWSLVKGFAKAECVRDCLIIPENMALFLSGCKGSEGDISLMNLRIFGKILPLHHSPSLVVKNTAENHL